MLRRHIVLLIAIRPSNGDVKPGGPLGAFREEQAMSRHRVSPSPFLSSSSHTAQLHYTNSYTYNHPNLNFLQYTIQILTRKVVCPSGAWIENRPHSTPSIRLAQNPKHVTVQWVGIGTHILFKILPILMHECNHRERWIRGNARDSHSGGPGFKFRGRPTWLRFFSGFLNLKIAKEVVIFQRKISDWSPYSTINNTI